METEVEWCFYFMLIFSYVYFGTTNKFKIVQQQEQKFFFINQLVFSNKKFLTF